MYGSNRAWSNVTTRLEDLSSISHPLMQSSDGMETDHKVPHKADQKMSQWLKVFEMNTI